MLEEKQKLPDMYLSEGEEIQWTGQPYFSRRVFWQNQDVRQRYFIWGVLALISGLVAFSGVDAIRNFITSLIVIFVMVLFYTIRSWNNLKQGFLVTRYVLTNKRLIVYNVQQATQISLPLSEIQKIEFVPLKDGYGTIKLGNNWALFSIPNASDVKTLLESLIS
jgi:hypothetical protein